MRMDLLVRSKIVYASWRKKQAIDRRESKKVVLVYTVSRNFVEFWLIFNIHRQTRQ